MMSERAAGAAECSWIAPLRVTRTIPDAFLPYPATLGAAGYDLTIPRDAVVPAKCKAICIDVGIAMAIPDGTYGRIAARSGLSLRTGLIVLAGVIDSDYRGSINVMFQNNFDEPVELKRGDKIAQIIFEKISRPIVRLVDDLDSTKRGTAGFGSTDNV
ncbi:deoxyuridine triphosphatase [Cyprinid herpesvirus 2]|uniref:dUTP diphosphatase n=1 Tax=Cyprinid herpesvirus 2 TaxID=317878 RepID=K7PCP1_CYHV2|nr:deoxyuridine triphosphatase [Cyprinid herpesvirus 2]AFJ20545.1 deoxyuridine triphosphatase [Cyprinid herpesvirus 2]